MSRKRDTLTIRLDPVLRARMDAARQAAPFRPSITAIVERGIALALDEIEATTAAATGGQKERQ